MESAAAVPARDPAPPAPGDSGSNPAVPDTVFSPDTGPPTAAVCPSLTANCGRPAAPAARAASAAGPAAPAAPPPPSPAQLAQQAYSQIRLAKPTIGSAPCTEDQCMGAVGVPVWLWTQPWTPQSATAAAGGISVTVTAKITNVAWAMGDGGTLTCTTPGTKFDVSMGFRDSPDCGYRYQKTSRGQPGGETYTVTATATWAVTWTGAVTATTTVTTAAAVQMAIGEYQVIVTG